MNVLNEFLSAIDIEKVKDQEEFEEQMRQPLNERIDKGVTMAHLKVELKFYDGLPNDYCRSLPATQKYIRSVKVYCEHNKSKFKEGSPVMLSNGKEKFEMDVEEDSLENFILKPNDFNVKNCYIDTTDYPKNNWEINTVKNDVSTKMLLTAANILRSNPSTLKKIETFLNGQTKNTFGSFTVKAAYLNESQNAAYHKAINASDFCLIQGPPGTGKTETIGFIAKQLVDVGLKVFITAPTHTAINNCMNAVASKVQNSAKVIKIGEKAQNKEVLNNPSVAKKSRYTYFSANYDSKGIAIGATAYSLCYPASKKLDGWEFDVIIVDEASQLSIPLSIAAMCRGGKYIFVGDHKQLDPIIPKNSGNEMFAESVFSRLAHIYPNEINLLNTSYRLNEKLIQIPNTLFYNNLLNSDSTTKEDTNQYGCLHHSAIVNGEPHRLVLHNVFDAKGRSPFEAKLVGELVADLIANGVDIKDIGVMSPYRAQVREMKKEIHKRIPKSISNPFDSMLIDTVDSMQGQERKYIIYSMGNSHPLESVHRLSFFYSPNRLNVAITRAINKCFVIANYKVFDIIDEEMKEQEEYNEIKDSLDIFKKYYSLSEKIEVFETDDMAW
jgi:DNA replication ATP-dependent helicase Dna2